MQNRGGIVAGIYAPQRVGNHRLSEIALGVALGDSCVDGRRKTAADKTDILTDFCKYKRHTGILTYGDIKFLCGAEIIAQAAHYILWHAVRFIFGAVFYKLGKVVRQKFIGFYARVAYSLGYEGYIYLTHRVYPP